jgi:CHAT domain-containing protein
MNATGVPAPQTAEAEETLRSRDFASRFALLPGTAREAREIPPLVQGDVARMHVYTGLQATVPIVKAARSPRILHIATHGFFLADQDFGPAAGTRGMIPILDAAVSVSSTPGTSARYENPLVRSGLALAGANHAREMTAGDDGLLTALEITEIGLSGTELVVLSACETAVGSVETGEGVFGWQRAFALAGARHLLMSLWPVDDALTAEQMEAFYREHPDLA